MIGKRVKEERNVKIERSGDAVVGCVSESGTWLSFLLVFLARSSSELSNAISYQT